MIQIDPNKAMENALGILWNSFTDSPLSSESTLESVGLSEYSGGYGFREWDGESDFYADSSVFLHHKSGCCFNWSVSVLFERGENDGVRWQHGVAYAWVIIILNTGRDDQMYYDIKSKQLPAGFGELASLKLFAKDVTLLAHICFEDLKYVFEINGFERLLQVSREKIDSFNSSVDSDGSYGWESNPLKPSSLRS